MLTNLGSIRDPFTGCSTVSLMGLIGSQAKHVLKMSARSNVVPSFCISFYTKIKAKKIGIKNYEKLQSHVFPVLNAFGALAAKNIYTHRESMRERKGGEHKKHET